MTQTVSHETRRADQLKPGDWVRGDVFDSDLDGLLAEILHTQPYTEFDRAKTLLVFRIEGDSPRSTDLNADVEIHLATEDEMASAKAAARRWEVAERLRSLASLIVDEQLPLPERLGNVDVMVNFGRDSELLAKLAEMIGRPVDSSYGTDYVHWDDEAPYSREVSVTWRATTPKETPMPATVAEMVAAREVDNADEPEPIPDGVDGQMIGRPVSAPPAIQDGGCE